MKIFLSFHFLLFPLVMSAMEQPQPVQEATTTYTVSESVSKALEDISSDGGILYHHLCDTFNGLDKTIREKAKPSAILGFFATKENTNEATKLSHMPATAYIERIIRPYFNELDRAFIQELMVKKDLKVTWEWFWGDYFKQKGIVEPLTAYKIALAKADEKRIGQAPLGAH